MLEQAGPGKGGNRSQLTEKGYESGRICCQNRLSFLSFGLAKGSRENGRKEKERT